MVLLVSFGIAGVLCGLSLLVAFLADNPHLVPDFSWLSAGATPVPALAPAPVAPVLAPVAPLPVFCELSGRWRDPVTRRFVRAPR